MKFATFRLKNNLNQVRIGMVDTNHQKIHEYDEETHSLVVSFASDDNELDVGEYRKYSFNISNFN